MREAKRSKFAEFISPLLLLYPEPESTTNEEGVLLLEEPDKVSNRYENRYVRVMFARNDMLDIEFFTESEDAVEIKIKNQEEETIYELKTFTAPTLHILVDTKSWNKGLYSINIKTENLFMINAIVC